MTDNKNKKKDIDSMEERIQQLEEINSWHMQALELMASLGDIHGTTDQNRDTDIILDNTRQYINRIIDMEGMAFLTLDDSGSSFEITYCNPEDIRSDIEQEVERLIDSGEFAWCLHHGRQLSTISSCFKRQILLQPLASRTRVRGMFIGIPPKDDACLTIAKLNLLSVILHNCAYALESAELYKYVKDQNRDLEETVENRNKELEYQMGHDSLTGLTNRLLFLDRINQAILRYQRQDAIHAVLMLDLDMFKRINDSLGHSAGDILLKAVAQRLKAALRNKDIISQMNIDCTTITISRLGGDEFGILITDINKIDHIVKVIQRIIETLSLSFHIYGHEVFITTSIGIALCPNDGKTPEVLLKNADMAMYYAKQQGRNNYQFYSDDINSKSFNHLVIENKLHHALESKQFILHYQPKIDIKTGKTTGAEALIRWVQSENVLLTPDQFIPIAEETGLIVPLGDWVLRTACQQAVSWHQAGMKDMQIAVNLSARQFSDKDLLLKIQNALDQTGLPPHCLEIEITESTVMEDVDANIEILNKLSKLGIRLAIDDFGTGYSSLNYLKRFPIDTLKIDKSFVNDVTNNPDDAAIVTAITALAHSLNLKVVAEGVETIEHLNFLRKLNCNEAQGFLFSKPIDQKEYMKLIKTQTKAITEQITSKAANNAN